MRVAIINPPLTAHLVRGTGTYINNLTSALIKYTKVEVVEADNQHLPADVDLYHFPFFDPFFRTLPFKRGKKTLVTVHDLIPLRFPEKFPRGVRGELNWQIQRFILGGVEGIITDSATSKKDIEKFVNIEPENIHFIYLAPADVFFKHASNREKEIVRQKYTLPREFALFVGDVNWNKNVPGVIRAATIAQLPLVIVSKSLADKDETYHPWRESLLEAKTAARNNPYIHAIGYIDERDLVVLYQQATVLVAPSFYEGFGLPVVEAFASGCPVVTSYMGSLAEIVDDAAVTINPTNVGEIAATLQTVFKDRQLRKRLSQSGRDQARKFTWTKTAQATYDIYAKTLKH